MSLSRWLNTASRFVRLYVPMKNPLVKLQQVVTFIMKVYVPFWFNVKKDKYCINGPRHLFWFIQNTRYLPKNLLAEVDKNIQTNGYFAHSENILLPMLANENKQHRKKAVAKILRTRQNQPVNAVRKFLVQ